MRNKIIFTVCFWGILSLNLSSCNDDYTTGNLGPDAQNLNNENDLNPNPVIGDSTNFTHLIDIAGTTERVSINSDNSEANQNSIDASISADGRFVVFDSQANNLVADDTNNTWDIFLRDRLNSATSIVSMAVDGTTGDGASLRPQISGNGHYVVFGSEASNLVASDTNGVEDIFIFDTQFNTIQRINLNIDNVEADAHSTSPKISFDGRFIVFQSHASNLTPDLVVDSTISHIYVYDRLSGQLELASLNSDNEVANNNSHSASISDDGRYVSFESDASNLDLSDSNGVSDIFVRDLLNNTITRINKDINGVQANQASVTPSISANGQFVVYRSNASNLLANDTNGVADIFVVNVQSGVTERVSINNNGEEANSSAFSAPVISADGQLVAYYSSASNLHANDNNNSWDIFVRDRANAITEMISIDSAGMIGNASSFIPAISTTGQYVVFGSAASNLVVDDTNAVWDIFLHVRTTSNLPPVADAGGDLNIYVGETVQLDGSLSYDPDANNSGPGPVSSYLWQLETSPAESLAVLSSNDIPNPTISPDISGQYIISLITNDGVLDSLPDEIIINASENLAPVAQINIDLQQGEGPLTVTFDASASVDPEGEMLAFKWDFDDPASGNDNSSSSLIATHTFIAPKRYHVLLTVTDAFGNSTDMSVQIDVLAPNQAPVVNPVADNLVGPSPLTVNFRANASDPEGAQLQYMWDFGDGMNSELSDPQHIFTDAGTYNVKLSVSDGELTSTAELVIVVDNLLVFDVLHAKLKYGHKGEDYDNAKLSFKGKVNIDEDFDMNKPITVVFDGVELFSVPLSDFKLHHKKHKHKKANNIIYKKKGVHARINLKRGIISVVARRLRANEINHCNGIDIIVSIGGLQGIDHIEMTEKAKSGNEFDDNFAGSEEPANFNKRHSNCTGDEVHNLVLEYKNLAHVLEDD